MKIFEINLQPLTLVANDIDHAVELAEDYFADKDFYVKCAEVKEI